MEIGINQYDFEVDKIKIDLKNMTGRFKSLEIEEEINKYKDDLAVSIHKTKALLLDLCIGEDIAEELDMDEMELRIEVKQSKSIFCNDYYCINFDFKILEVLKDTHDTIWEKT